jgi:hypothetical protein
LLLGSWVEGVHIFLPKCEAVVSPTEQAVRALRPMLNLHGNILHQLPANFPERFIILLTAHFLMPTCLADQRVCGPLVMAYCLHENFLQQPITQVQGNSCLCTCQKCSFSLPLGSSSLSRGPWMSGILDSSSAFRCHQL